MSIAMSNNMEDSLHIGAHCDIHVKKGSKRYANKDTSASLVQAHLQLHGFDD